MERELDDMGLLVDTAVPENIVLFSDPAEGWGMPFEILETFSADKTGAR